MGASLGSTVDYARLSAYLRVLGVANRLRLLRTLQVPRTVAELRVRPARRDAGRSPERPLTRQAVELHLQKLRRLGLVQAEHSRREGRTVLEYTVNVARLFAVADELRRASLLATAPAGALETQGREPTEPADPSPGPLPAGPALVVVRGPEEGVAFPLRGPGPWMLGRARGLAVTLPYDPFVSKENTRVWRGGPRFLVATVAGSRNGTRLNWRPLAEGEAAPLEPGDTLGVGRSMLVFRGPGR